MTDLQTIKTRHESLFARYCQSGNGKSDGGFATELTRFLDTLKEAVKEARQPDDYLWFSDAVAQWRSAGPSLGVPVEIVLPPPAVRDTAPPFADSEGQLKQLVMKKAGELGRDRIVAWYNARSIEEMTAAYRQRFGGHEAWRREQEDWALAETHLASDVIERRVDLVHDFGPDSYWRLEGLEGRMWLARVVALKAYYHWIEKGQGWGDTQAVYDYVWATRALRELVNDRARKAAQVSFEPIATYIRHRYVGVDGQLIDNEFTRGWIRAKAERLVEKRQLPSWDEAVRRARRSMKKFYEHIVSAVLTGDDLSVREVQEALGFRSGSEESHEMVNCFEFALAVYFLEGPEI